MNYDFTIKHIPRKENIIADFLSRIDHQISSNEFEYDDNLNDVVVAINETIDEPNLETNFLYK